MYKDERDLLEVLKFELEFLEKGGYGRSPREPWRPLAIFEDSPTCMNYDTKENPEPCGACVLMHLVPPQLQSEKIPCRHIPLNADGETLDSLYRWGDQHEIEDTVENWLRATIAKLEEERKGARGDERKNVPPGDSILSGTPLHHNLHPKCANPSCPTAFHWLGGGKFFRFRPSEAAEGSSGAASNSPENLHDVKHFWLCEHCAQVFTLVYEEEHGVVLKLLRLELPVTETPNKRPATQPI